MKAEFCKYQTRHVPTSALHTPDTRDSSALARRAHGLARYLRGWKHSIHDCETLCRDALSEVHGSRFDICLVSLPSDTTAWTAPEPRCVLVVSQLKDCRMIKTISHFSRQFPCQWMAVPTTSRLFPPARTSSPSASVGGVVRTWHLA